MRVGSQTPRVQSVPEGAVGSLADDPILLAELAGMRLDEWQEYILQVACATRADGKWAAFEVGLEVPRQNGKTAAIEALLLAAAFVWDCKTTIYSAHEFKTTAEIFRRVERVIRSTPVLNAQVEKVRYGNDDKSILLRDGSVLRFLPRSSGSGRGFSGDLIVLDEAFNLSSEMMAAMLPTMAARSVQGNPQIWYLSSAGMVSSDFLNGIRRRALDDEGGSLAWLEWSCPKDVDPDDPDGWYVSNPALGIRISEDYVRNELSSFRSDPERGESVWLRERLGVRESVDGDQFFDMDRWDELCDANVRASDILAFAVSVPPSRDSASIGMASILGNGDVMVELVDQDAGTAWVPSRLRELVDRHSPKHVVVDPRSAGMSLVPDLQGNGVRVSLVETKDYEAAAGQVYDMVHSDDSELGLDRPRLVHIGQPELDDAVRAARPRRTGDGSAFLWEQKKILTNMSPLIAVTLALAGLQRERRTVQRVVTGNVKKRKAVVYG